MAKDSKAGIFWLFKMAWRDVKASRKKLTLFMASIVLGIAAVVSIQSFGVNLKENIALESKALMGADFKIDSSKPPSERVMQIIDSLGGFQAQEINFVSMASFPKNGATKLMQVRGIEGGFPFYGELKTEPKEVAKLFQVKEMALVDETAMLQLELQVGDTIKVGKVSLPIGGKLKNIPGSTSLFGSVAPTVVIPYQFIEQTGLVQTGSRIGYEFYFEAPTANLSLLEKNVDPVLDDEEADLDTHTATSERLGEGFNNFGKFLNLVAFISLLLGCVGIASAIYIYIKDKIRSIAVLKCLGASRKQTFLIYLIQVAFMGLIGGIIGTLFGLIIQQFFPWLLDDLLPVSVQISVSFSVVFMGIVLGIVMSVLFALYPLISTLNVSPLQALRVIEEKNKNSIQSIVLVSISIVLFILVYAYWILDEWNYAFGFVISVLFTFSILSGLAYLFIQGIRRFFPSKASFVARQSLLNLFRPKNQTLTLVLSIGVGTFLISTLYFTKDLLLDQASLDAQTDSPNMVLLDVQSHQREQVVETIKSNNLPVLSDVPIVTMRVHSIGDKTASELRKDSLSKVNGWILSHEFRTTFRDELIDSEVVVDGKWTPRFTEKTDIPISVSDNFALLSGVGIGDKIIFNVQGVLLKTVIGSIRKVDWSQMDLNFTVLFPVGVLEDAPKFHVVTTKLPNEEQSAALQKDLVKLFPNVSIIDLSQVLNLIEDILDKISWIINFMAFFSILTGIIVLLGAIRTSKFQRIKESVLLRTLGAKSKQILYINALEYFYLGVLGALSGVLLSLVGSQLLAWLVFDSPFSPSMFPFLVLFPSILLIVMLIGLSNSIEIIRKSPLEVLRNDAV